MELKQKESIFDTNKAWFNIGISLDENDKIKIEMLENVLPKNYPYYNFSEYGKDKKYDIDLKRREKLKNLVFKLSKDLESFFENFERTINSDS